ncbi:MAG TPA: hypothetical protein VFL57_15075, partial [Bryobacteraceae bacterium]|nr:hypothetical protein [Bryobacteraceae bacterium]
LRNGATRLTLRRSAVLWGLQAAFLTVLLLMIWQPALSVSMLKPQQNVITVVVDDSRSMALREGSASRKDQAVGLLDSGLLARLKQRFQVRLYRASADLERINTTAQLDASGSSTQLARSLRQVVAEAATLPVGAVVLIGDGAENAGGIDLETINAIRRQRIPIHTVGIGRERPDRDVEITDVQTVPRAMADSRIPVQVSLRQFGYEDRRARLKIAAPTGVLASQEVVLKKDGAVQTETAIINAGAAGAKTLSVSLEPLGGEENTKNNAVNRLLTVEDRKPRILYIEGEPRWEFKFLRRAAELDGRITLVSMLRTTQNKIYRQGISGPAELEQGFPATVEEMFAYQGLIVGGIEAAYFTPTQQELIKQFADRRGGGVLFLGGRAGLGDGGWGASAAADMLPVILPSGRNTFRRDPANVELSAAGRDSVMCRLEEDPERNAERWRKLPYLMNYQDAGRPKPAAVVLAWMSPGGSQRLPLLVTQNYGRGRTAVFATAGSWRWQMQLPLSDLSHEMFWQQMLRWLVEGTSERVVISSDKTVYSDDTTARLTASVRDKAYLPAADATVEARVIAPGGSEERHELRPDPQNPGTYTLPLAVPRTGSHVIEVIARRGAEEIGRDALTLLREDGVAENFRTEQNRELLEKLAAQTGGRYYTAANAGKLAEEIAYSEAGISTRETRELWNMPLLFFLALVFKGSEWGLRRKWGIV